MPVFVRASRRAKAHTRRTIKETVTMRARRAIKKIDLKMGLEMAAGRGGQKRANSLQRRRELVQKIYWMKMDNSYKP